MGAVTNALRKVGEKAKAVLQCRPRLPFQSLDDKRTCWEFERSETAVVNAKKVGFTQIDHAVWGDLMRITQPGSQPLVLLYLMRQSVGRARGEGEKPPEWTPDNLTAEAIAEVLHYKVRKIQLDIAQLVGRGLVETKKTGNGAAKFRVLPVKNWPDLESYDDWVAKQPVEKANPEDIPAEDEDPTHTATRKTYFDKPALLGVGEKTKKVVVDSGVKSLRVVYDGKWGQARAQIENRGGDHTIYIAAVQPDSKEINELTSDSRNTVRGNASSNGHGHPKSAPDSPRVHSIPAGKLHSAPPKIVRSARDQKAIAAMERHDRMRERLKQTAPGGRGKP